MAPINKAFGIARVPEIAARIIRELDREGLLGPHITIAGTNALHAYEAAAGVLIVGRYTTTQDADLIWDNRQSLLLSATSVVRRDGLMSILRRVQEMVAAILSTGANTSPTLLQNMEFRTHHVPPRVFIYTDAERARRKVRTLLRLGVSFTLTNRAGELVSAENLFASPQR